MEQTGHPPVGAGGVGDGGVGVVGLGGGPPPSPGHAAHQQVTPFLPQLLFTFSSEQLPPAVDPSAQMVASIGWFLAQTYLVIVGTVGGAVGAGVGGLVGGGNVGNAVGLGVGRLVGFGVGGGFVGNAVGAFVGFGVGRGFVGNAVGLGVGGLTGAVLSVMVTSAVPGNVVISILSTVTVTVFP